MLIVRSQSTKGGREKRYSLTLFYLFQIAITIYEGNGSHLDLSIGFGPLDITLGTTVWKGVYRR